MFRRAFRRTISDRQISKALNYVLVFAYVAEFFRCSIGGRLRIDMLDIVSRIEEVTEVFQPVATPRFDLDVLSHLGE